MCVCVCVCVCVCDVGVKGIDRGMGGRRFSRLGQVRVLGGDRGMLVSTHPFSYEPARESHNIHTHFPPKKQQHNKNSIRAQFEKSNMTTALRK